MSPLADRRRRIRYEVLGRLRGNLEIVESARVINLSSAGALIETAAPIAVGSPRSIELTVQGQPARIKTTVCRLTNVGEERQGRYAVALEFVPLEESRTAGA